MSSVIIKSDKVILACELAISKYEKADRQTIKENIGTYSQYKLYRQETRILHNLVSLCSIAEYVHLCARDFIILKRYPKALAQLRSAEKDLK